MRPRVGARLVLILAMASLLVSACTTPAQPPRTAPLPTESVTPSEIPAPRVIASDLVAPWSITFAGNTPIISERDTGRMVELDSEGRKNEVGQLDDVRFGGEGGLLGLAFLAPNLLYVYSTGHEGNRIQRFELTGSAGSFKLAHGQTLLDSLPSATVHNGGRLAFGPDGMLYATVGDASQPEQAQDLHSLGGKILRMTPDGQVPADNPLPGSLVYSFGHRNPQGLAWSADGTMYASEFGQNNWDELNSIIPGGNYGWPVVEGISQTTPYIDPLQQWSTDLASPSGISIAHGVLYMANLRGQRLRTLQVADPANQTELFVQEYGRLRDVVRSPSGKIWMLTNNTDGRGQPTKNDDRVLEIKVP